MSIEELMDMRGDLETLDEQALETLVEELINLKNAASSQQQEISRLQADSMTDPLTGAYNGRVLYQEVERSLALANRYNRTSALIIFQLDDFESITEHFGGQVGAQVMSHVVRLLKQNIRPTDIIARSDNTQFSVLLNEIRTLDDTEDRAQGLLAILTGTPCILSQGSVHVTANMGFCFFNADATVDGIFDAAEDDLRRRSTDS